MLLEELGKLRIVGLMLAATVIGTSGIFVSPSLDFDRPSRLKVLVMCRNHMHRECKMSAEAEVFMHMLAPRQHVVYMSMSQ